MKRYIKRERPRRINGCVEQRELQIEEEKLQSSRDFKEITFAITLFGGLLAFLIKLRDYFNNNVVVISGYSLIFIYFIVWLTFFTLTLLFIFLIFKWYLISINNENNLLKTIIQKLFGLIPLFIVLWLITLFLIMYITRYKDEIDTIIKILKILGLAFLIIIFVKLLESPSPKKALDYIKSNLKDNIFTYFIIFYGVIALVLILVMTFFLPIYLLTGTYYIDESPTFDTNSNIITFTIKETGISYSNNFITLYN